MRIALLILSAPLLSTLTWAHDDARVAALETRIQSLEAKLTSVPGTAESSSKP